jgi:hypothetical protein
LETACVEFSSDLKARPDHLTAICCKLYARLQETDVLLLKFGNDANRSNPPLSMLLLQPDAGVSMSDSN